MKIVNLENVDYKTAMQALPENFFDIVEEVYALKHTCEDTEDKTLFDVDIFTSSVDVKLIVTYKVDIYVKFYQGSEHLRVVYSTENCTYNFFSISAFDSEIFYQRKNVTLCYGNHLHYDKKEKASLFDFTYD